MPSQSELIQALRNTVRQHCKTTTDPPTVNEIRTKAEQSLGLSEGFYKEAAWKSKSKEIIHEEYQKIEAGETSEPDRKRSSSPEPDRPVKKLKLDDDESSALSDVPSDMSKKAKARKTKQKSKLKETVESEDEAESPAAAAAEKEDDSSDLSSVIDEPPARRKSKSKSTEAKPKKSTTKAKPTKAADDPDTEEIKRLQSWLVKCGIRKVWGKELKPYETSKAKIKHLKSMLEDAGMTGRYSNEKAAAIKEQRELAADIEAVVEGNERWGMDEDEGNGERPKRGQPDTEEPPKRRLVRGAANYDFLSSDGEETD